MGENLESDGEFGLERPSLLFHQDFERNALDAEVLADIWNPRSIRPM
jgi:hypothetical protein